MCVCVRTMPGDTRAVMPSTGLIICLFVKSYFFVVSLVEMEGCREEGREEEGREREGSGGRLKEGRVGEVEEREGSGGRGRR